MLQGTFSAVASASGYQALLAAIASDAWVDIQNLRGADWDFLRTSRTFSTVASQTEYTITDILGSATSTIGKWDTKMVLYDDKPLKWYDYRYYITSKQDEAGVTKPTLFAIDPVDQHLYINPPAGIYSITAHYFKKPIVLTADADVPAGGPEFHFAILYRTIAEMTAVLGNTSVSSLYTQKADAVIGSLLRHSNPAKKVKSPGIA
jgi:hypothetical protein